MAFRNRGRSHKCSRCGDTFAHSSSLWEHMRSHLGNYHRCSVCEEVLTSDNKLKRHMKIHIAEEQNSIAVNEEVKFQTPEKKHIPLVVLQRIPDKQHNVTVYKVKDNRGEKQCKVSLNDNSRSVLGVGSVRRKKRKRSINAENKANTGEKQLNPPVRGEIMVRGRENQSNSVSIERSGMLSEIKKSKEGKPFHCSECDQTFALQVALDKHMLSHIDKKPQRCCHCGELFFDLSDLHAHVTIVHSKDTLLESSCDNKYPVLRDRLNHMTEKGAKYSVEDDADDNRNASSMSSGTMLQTRPDKSHMLNDDFSLSQFQKRGVLGEQQSKRFNNVEMKAQAGENVPNPSVEAEFKVYAGENQFNTVSGEERDIFSVVKNIVCSECDQAFAHQEDLEEHMLSHIDKKPQRCCQCGELFFTPSELKAHITSDHAVNIFLEGSCDRRVFGNKYPILTETANRTNYSEHSDYLMVPDYKDVHSVNDQSHSVNASSTVSGIMLQGATPDERHTVNDNFSGSQFQTDEKNEGESKAYQVTHGERFRLKFQKKNKYSSHSEYAKRLGNQSQQSEDRRNQTETQCRKCSSLICETEVQSSSSTVSDIDEDQKSHKCSRCGMLFSQLSEQCSGTNPKPHKCLQCVLEFSTVSELNSHMISHMEDKIFSSEPNTEALFEENQINLEDISTLGFAIDKGQTRRKQFECPECGKLLNTRHTLDYHMRIHTGDAPFKCSHCSERFRHLCQLRTHYVSHTGYKPYMCYFCGKEFVYAFRCKQHMMSHTGERPYKCLHCSRPFSRLSNLNRHLVCHHKGEKLDRSTSFSMCGGVKIYWCPICGKGFRWTSGLSNHMKEHTAQKLSQVGLADSCPRVENSCANRAFPNEFPVLRDALNHMPKGSAKYSEVGVKTEHATDTAGKSSLVYPAGTATYLEQVTHTAVTPSAVGLPDTGAKCEQVTHTAVPPSEIGLADTGAKCEQMTHKAVPPSEIGTTDTKASAEQLSSQSRGSSSLTYDAFLDFENIINAEWGLQSGLPVIDRPEIAAKPADTYTCSHCNKEFEQVEDLYQHLAVLALFDNDRPPTNSFIPLKFL